MASSAVASPPPPAASSSGTMGGGGGDLGEVTAVRLLFFLNSSSLLFFFLVSIAREGFDRSVVKKKENEAKLSGTGQALLRQSREGASERSCRAAGGDHKEHAGFS